MGCAKNLLASAAVVWIASAAYAAAPYYNKQLRELYGWVGFSFTGLQFLVAAAGVYTLLLGVYYLLEASPGVSKSLQFWRVLGGFVRAPIAVARRGLLPDERLAVLATILKGFFGPMMVIILLQSFMGCLFHGAAIVSSANSGAGFYQTFNRHGFWFAMQLIVVVDVAVFTVGYLVEMRHLKNEIRSVDPTLLGWVAALLCYFPFSSITGYVLGRQVSDFPQFDDPTAHVALNLTLLGLMAVYTSASVALGLKASNLTHRGVVTRGPYAVVRHPAYACKNMAWWIGSIPVVSAAFSLSLFAGVSAVASVIGWTLLYVLRALTEEDHLRRVDGDYAAYAARVRYRFIPGLV